MPILPTTSLCAERDRAQQGGWVCFRSNQRLTYPAFVASAGATRLAPDHFPKATIALQTLRLMRLLIVAVVAASIEGLLSVALETCASRAVLGPEQLQVHLVAYGAFLRRVLGVNLRREVFAEETESLALAVHRGVCCARIHTSSVGTILFSA